MTDKLKVESPYNNMVINEFPMSGENDVMEAIETAYSIHRDRSKWIPKYEIVDILEKTAEIMKGRRDELVRIASEEGGKPWRDSMVEVNRAINGLKLAVEYMGEMSGREVPMGHTVSSAGRLALTTREPIGVVASISAFNHPLNLIVHQTIPAIAARCPVIIKPALTTPGSCFNFVNILYEAGLPEEWCRALVCSNEISEKLVTDSRIAYFSFIGSARAGWYLRSRLAPGTRCALEHGGSAPVIMEKDADMDSIMPLLVKGGFYHAGQVCVSVQRLFVHRNIADDTAFKMTELVKKLITGDPLEEETDVGPLILGKEVDRVESWVNEACDKGGKILCGGKRISESCYEPTVIMAPPYDVKVSTEEVFGPVVCIYPYTDRDEAIRRANSLPYAFQASVITRDIDTALDTAKKLDASAVMINDHTAFRVDWMPFGGRRMSGIGVGGIPYSMHEMTQEKLIVFKSDRL